MSIAVTDKHGECVSVCICTAMEQAYVEDKWPWRHLSRRCKHWCLWALNEECCVCKAQVNFGECWVCTLENAGLRSPLPSFPISNVPYRVLQNIKSKILSQKPLVRLNYRR